MCAQTCEKKVNTNRWQQEDQEPTRLPVVSFIVKKNPFDKCIDELTDAKTELARSRFSNASRSQLTHTRTVKKN